MKIIRAMRVARARARGLPRVGRAVQREEGGRGESCMSLRGSGKGITGRGGREEIGERERKREKGRLSDRRCGKEGKGSVQQGRPVVIAPRSASRTGLKRVTGVRRGRGERENEQDGRNRSLVFRHGPDNVRYGEIPVSFG